MLKIQEEPRAEQNDEPDPHSVSFIATDIEIKTNGIKGDYQNCSGELQEQKEGTDSDLKEQMKITKN